MDAQSLLSTVLASAIHEIKNNLGVLFARIDHLTSTLNLSTEQQSELSQLKTINDTVNHELVRVLLLYKSNIGGYKPNIDQHALIDFFDDTITRHSITAQNAHIELKNQCDKDLLGFFDHSLLSSALDTAIFNSVNAGASEISFSGREENGILVITISDNGPGFPEWILDAEMVPKSANGTGTGLGLYFAQTIAQLHENDGVRGFIKLMNGSSKGSQLEIWLP